METLVGLLLLAVGINIGMQVGGVKFKKTQIKEPDPEQLEKQKTLDDHFEGLLNYDASQAYRGHR